MGDVAQEYRSWFSHLPVQTQKDLDRGKEITSAMVANARQAAAYWALWEGLNDRMAMNQPLNQALAWAVPRGLVEVHASLAQSAIMATLRISDSSQSLTGCLLSGLLRNDQLLKVLVTKEWLAGGQVALDADVIVSELENQPKRIEWFNSVVPLDWGPHQFPPADDTLLVSRNKLKVIRDKVIAHTDKGVFTPPTIGQIRAALIVATEVAKIASLIFLGHTSDLDKDLTDRKRMLDEFWHYFERGVVATHEAWLDQKSKLDTPAT